MVKRAFLRACINQGCLDHDIIDQILSPLCEHHQVTKPANRDQLYKFVAEIGGSVKGLSQTLTFINHPINGKEYLVFAITDATPDQHNHPGLTAEECQYFSMVLDKLGHEEDCHIAWNEAYADLNFKGSVKAPKRCACRS